MVSEKPIFLKKKKYIIYIYIYAKVAAGPGLPRSRSVSPPAVPGRAGRTARRHGLPTGSGGRLRASGLRAGLFLPAHPLAFPPLPPSPPHAFSPFSLPSPPPASANNDGVIHGEGCGVPVTSFISAADTRPAGSSGWLPGGSGGLSAMMTQHKRTEDPAQLVHTGDRLRMIVCWANE